MNAASTPLPYGLPHDVQLLHVVAAADYPPAGGAFVWNGAGRGELAWRTDEANQLRRGLQVFDSFLMLGDVPLIQWQSENGCPTCTQLLQAGDVPDNELEQFATAINQLTNDTPIESCLLPLTPVLQLLPAGLYFVGFDDYIPTNGEGRFFWRAFGELRPSRPLPHHILYDPRGNIRPLEESTRPMFLAPTQSTAKFRDERFNAARLTYRDAPGLALYLGGRLSALLDGHHRATCAAMNGVRFRALTISPAEVTSGSADRQGGLFAPGAFVPWPQISPFCRDWLQHPPCAPASPRSASPHVNIADCHAALQRVVWPELPQQVTKVMNLDIYPTDQQCDLIATFQEGTAHIPNEVIENAFAGNSDHMDERWILDHLLQALFAAQDPRAVSAALRAVQLPGWSGVWRTAYELLATVRTEEVESQFVQFLVDDDGSRPEIKAIVDRYFATNVS